MAIGKTKKRPTTVPSPGGEGQDEGGRKKPTSFSDDILYFFIMPDVERARALRK
ncbi:MAG TPA: hypothetical protein VJT54_15505 [Verrucomicrobiae bacterium]|nr:hypothetical protein [Verrucomicrobiae bacterium]